MKNVSFTGGDSGAAAGNRKFIGGDSPVVQPPSTDKNKRGNYFHHIPVVARLIAKVKAYFIVRGVKSALKEVDLIEKGIKQPKSLDQLLRYL